LAFAHTRPPWASTIERVIARPYAGPVRLGGDEGFKICSGLWVGNPTPVSRTEISSSLS
jgi:hypothetical protein